MVYGRAGTRDRIDCMMSPRKEFYGVLRIGKDGMGIWLWEGTMALDKTAPGHDMISAFASYGGRMGYYYC